LAKNTIKIQSELRDTGSASCILALSLTHGDFPVFTLNSDNPES